MSTGAAAAESSLPTLSSLSCAHWQTFVYGPKDSQYATLKDATLA